MYTTIRGLYDNGKILLYEQPPIDAPTEVLVTFTKEVVPVTQEATPHQGRRGGYAKDYILYVAPDFDDPIDDLFDVFKE